MRLFIVALLALGPAAWAGEIEIKTDELKMTDGVKLSVTYFLPPEAKTAKVPVLLELLPYRKDDEFLARDYSLCEYFARHGLAIARVDVRGTGSSEGMLPKREYSEAELRDAVNIIGQLSKLPWSNGNVGMYGISWSGFNAIMVAMRKPKALKAILATNASDDLFHDDVHYIDGIFHADEYSLDIDHANGLPRSPDYKIDETYFRNRFDTEPWVFTYKAMQNDGPFWRKNSARFNRPLEIPAFLISGLLDGYRDSVPRMLERAKTPVKALIGPWNHSWPDNASPGPAYDWRPEAVRWWNHWLRGQDTGILKEPRVTLFVRKSHKPDLMLKETPGDWRREHWPLKRKKETVFFLKPDGRMSTSLGLSAGRVTKAIAPKPGTGSELGYWWGETTPDMVSLDKDSLTFTTDALEKDMEIVGFPSLQFPGSSGSSLSQWVARLEEVRPDGTVAFVTGGALNGAQRDSATNPKAEVPGEFSTYKFNLHFTTWVFPKGHRIRLALTSGAFPMLWPVPSKAENQVQVMAANSFLSLPVIPFDRKVQVMTASNVEPRRAMPGFSSNDDKAWSMIPEISRQGGVVTASGKGEESRKQGEITVKSGQTTEYKLNEQDPAKASFTGTYFHEFPGFKLSSRMEIESDASDFRILFRRTISEGEKVLREKTWEKKIPRRFQ